MNNYPSFFSGTPKTWASTGGTYTITLNSKTTGVGQEGAKGDLFSGFGMPAFIEWWLEWAASASLTSGSLVELWVGESDSPVAGTNNPGTLTGVDAAVSNIADYKFQLSRVGALRLYNVTTAQKTSVGILVPKRRFMIPVVINLSGVTSNSTASNFLIKATPWYRKIVS